MQGLGHVDSLSLCCPFRATGNFGILTEGVALGYGVMRPFRPLGIKAQGIVTKTTLPARGRPARQELILS